MFRGRKDHQIGARLREIRHRFRLLYYSQYLGFEDRSLASPVAVVVLAGRKPFLVLCIVHLDLSESSASCLKNAFS